MGLPICDSRKSESILGEPLGRYFRLPQSLHKDKRYPFLAPDKFWLLASHGEFLVVACMSVYNIYIYDYMTCMCICVYLYTCIYVYVSVSISVCVCVYCISYMYVCIYIYVCTCVHLYMCICVYVYAVHRHAICICVRTIDADTHACDIRTHTYMCTVSLVLQILSENVFEAQEPTPNTVSEVLGAGIYMFVHVYIYNHVYIYIHTHILFI